MKAKSVQQPRRKIIPQAPKIIIPARGSVSLLDPMPPQDATHMVDTPAREIMRCPRCKSALETTVISQVPLRRDTKCTNGKCKFRSNGINVATAGPEGRGSSRGGRSLSPLYSAGGRSFFIPVTDVANGNAGHAVNAVATLTIPALTFYAGQFIIVGVNADTGFGTISGTWNSIALHLDAANTDNGPDCDTWLFSLPVGTEATGDIVLTFSTPQAGFGVQAAVVVANNLSPSVPDKIALAGPGFIENDTVSFATTATSQANELAIGIVGGVPGPNGSPLVGTVGPAWHSGFTHLVDQDGGDFLGSISVAYKILTTAEPCTCSYTLGLATTSAIVATYKQTP